MYICQSAAPCPRPGELPKSHRSRTGKCISPRSRSQALSRSRLPRLSRSRPSLKYGWLVAIHRRSRPPSIPPSSSPNADPGRAAMLYSRMSHRDSGRLVSTPRSPEWGRIRLERRVDVESILRLCNSQTTILQSQEEFIRAVLVQSCYCCPINVHFSASVEGNCCGFLGRK